MSEQGCGEQFVIEMDSSEAEQPEVNIKVTVACSKRLPCPACAEAHRAFVKRFDVWDASSEWDGDYLDDVLEARRAIEQREGG